MAENKDKSTGEKKGFFSWDRSMDILKIAVTFYAACIGTFVTMQFNERQHELAKMEAISKMLPHLADQVQSDKSAGGAKASQGDDDKDDDDAAAPSSNSRLARDGAIWAIFRTANNKKMLRDLATLFPEDIYRVVSSIAAGGGVEHDDDAITALQVASEKLANQYSSQNEPELASRLYSQAVRFKMRKTNADTPLNIVDLNEKHIEGPHTEDSLAEMLRNVNKLADLHLHEAQTSKRVNTERWTAKQFYKRVRQLGTNATAPNAKLEVAKADLALFDLYHGDASPQSATYYLKDAIRIDQEVYGPDSPEVAKLTDKLNKYLKEHANDRITGTAEPHRSPS